MAQALFKQRLQANGNENCFVSSAGLDALVGKSADQHSMFLLKEIGVDITEFTACQINREMIRKSDLILVMEQEQKRVIENIEPSSKGKVFRLGEWGSFDVFDPYKENIATFRQCFHLIDKGVNEWMEKITPR